MRILATLLQKEFKQIFRNRFILPVIFILPVVQLILLTYAASLEMKDIRMVVVDMDHSTVSRRLVNEFSGSPFFRIVHRGSSYPKASELLTRDRADVILVMEPRFEKNFYREQSTDLQLAINAINATEAGLVNAYCTQIIAGFNNELRSQFQGGALQIGNTRLDISPRFWYNPMLDYKIYMFSGILVILVTLIGMMLTALNLVREKEMGTSEQINVTPIRKYQFIIAKLTPFWFIALLELAVGLVIGRILFHLPIEGSLLLLFSFATVYLLAVLGIGLFLSTISSTQQQVMFVAFFFIVTFILMSGVFTPTESMPPWAQKANILNPAAYFMRVIRMVLLKGSGLQDIGRDFLGISVYAAVTLTLAVVNYRKTT